MHLNIVPFYLINKLFTGNDVPNTLDLMYIRHKITTEYFVVYVISIANIDYLIYFKLKYN